jgi:hypothetical protein
MLLENCTFFDNSITTTAGDTNSRAAGVDIRDTNSCIIRNCIMSGSVNFGSGNGARAVGINLNGNSHIIENCTFLGNTYLGNAVSSSLPVKAVGIYLEEVKTSSFIVISNCRASGNADLSGTNSGIGFHIGSNTQSCIIKDCQAYDNTHIGFNNISTGAAFLFGNIAAGNPANNYDGTGTFSFVTVTNGINPPQGSFDERQIDNISIV